jgi:hypothetical protein
LTAAGRWATAADTILRTVSRLFFFPLPFMRQQPNYTSMLKNLLKLYCIWTWDTLWHFLFCFVFSPLMRQQQNHFWDTIYRIGGWGMNTKIIKTETLLHLKLEIFILLFFSFIYFLFFISIFYLSNACSAFCWLIHYLSLFISLKLCCLFCFFYLFVYLFFPFCLTPLFSISHSSILNITIVIITS